jgi:hypothetical protein
MPEFSGTLRPPRLSSPPGSPVAGQLYYDTGTNKLFWWNGTAWIDSSGGVKTFRLGHTWAIAGALTAGMAVPHIFVPEASGQAATLVGARAVIGSGTSVGAQVQRNGSNLGSVISVTTTAGTTAFSQALSDADTLDIVLSSPVGSPSDLSFTLIVEHVV